MPARSGAAKVRRAVAGRRQRHGEAESRAGAGFAVDRDAAVHAFDDALGDRQPQAGAAELARRGAVGLLEVAEDARLVFRLETDAGVAHQETDVVARARLDDHGDAACLR